MATIYNSTDGPLIIDPDGHILGGREHRKDVDVDLDPAKAHVAAGRVIVTKADDAPTKGK